MRMTEILIAVVFMVIPSALDAQKMTGGEISDNRLADVTFSGLSDTDTRQNSGRMPRSSTIAARLAISTNVADWAWCLTPNVSVQYGLAQHWTLTADAKYNRWTFNDDSVDGRIRQGRQEYAVGARWWNWYTYSGWWVGGKAQYREYSGNGILGHSFGTWGDRYVKEEGDAVGCALSFGYSLQIAHWFDIDFGFGVWGGYCWYKQYSGEENGQVCPRYGKRIDAPEWEPASKAWFFGLNEVVISAVFIF